MPTRNVNPSQPNPGSCRVALPVALQIQDMLLAAAGSLSPSPLLARGLSPHSSIYPRWILRCPSFPPWGHACCVVTTNTSPNRSLAALGTKIGIAAQPAKLW